MNNLDRARELVDEYVEKNGDTVEMNRGEFIEWVHQTYENISIEKMNLYPTDMCFNLFNAGLRKFPQTSLCLLYVFERETFRLVGSKYKPNCDVIQHKNTKREKVVGRWENGVFKFF